MNSLRPHSKRRSAKRKTKDDTVIFIDEERTCHTRSQSRKIELGNELPEARMATSRRITSLKQLPPTRPLSSRNSGVLRKACLL